MVYPPQKIPKIDKLLFNSELIRDLSIPFIIEVMGMPQSGKTSSIHSFLKKTSALYQGTRIRLVQEGARTIPSKYKYIKYKDTFGFHLMGGIKVFKGILNNMKHSDQFGVIVQDRGMLDWKVFAQALFTKRRADLKWKGIEEFYLCEFEPFIFPIGGVIMCLTRPEISLEREGQREKPGIVMNRKFLKILYEQYLRFHSGILHGDILLPCYTCLDLECKTEEGLKKFNYAIDQMLQKLFRIIRVGVRKTKPH